VAQGQHQQPTRLEQGAELAEGAGTLVGQDMLPNGAQQHRVEAKAAAQQAGQLQ
jgi:hypothetical protein